MHSLLVGYSKATHFDPVWLRNSSRTNIHSETFQLHPFDLLYPEQRHVATHATGTRASAHMTMGRKKKPSVKIRSERVGAGSTGLKVDPGGCPISSQSISLSNPLQLLPGHKKKPTFFSFFFFSSGTSVWIYAIFLYF